MGTTGYVLVVGATGGVGRRIVDNLRKKGLPIKALVFFLNFAHVYHAISLNYELIPSEVRHEACVRNEDKARKMLGTDIELIVGDITKASTLPSEYFRGVKKVINAASVIIGPKEGDTPDRAKYSQVKGDSPEMVEYIGMKNLINAVRESVGLRTGKLLFGFEDRISKELDWGALDDVVMGGVSESTFRIDRTGGENGKPTGLFKGIVSTANNGGFSSIRTKNFSSPVDLSAYDGLELRLKGDGCRYKLIVRTSTDWDTVGYTASFDTVGGQWQSIRLPFSTLRPIFRARTVSDAPPFDPRNVVSFQLMFSKFEYDGKLNPTFVEGPFELPLSSIKAYMKDPITTRFVHVSSAGVTRPDRPGIDLSKQPPAVRLNKELDFVLTFKLKGEDLLRESGIPYAIVRPCALTEEPAGADLIFDQGDNITGKISREEIALICIAALESPYACDKTFEVKSVIPFSEPFTVDPENPPPVKDYNIYFQTLKDGITGKESLEQSAPV
ncbi:ras-related protein RABA1c-like [Hibiscus syriacus]|uniref:Ras-related protein RABA1c-like n=1 Tax=Hibiscus syriacus TaxID=106335 RepID=A0A6A3CN45_HIBSY|nr:ras-related protein RABA1c-like [Hibiscus syriacus]